MTPTSNRDAPFRAHWIDGHAATPTSAEYLDSMNPATGDIATRLARGNEQDVAVAAEAAVRAQPAWAATPPIERSRMLYKLAAAIRERSAEFVMLEVAETGKVAPAVEFEIQGSANYFEYYASILRSLHGETIDLGPDQHIFTRHEPYGVVGIITPWNVPLLQFARAVAPALGAGNAVLAKPSEFTSSTSVEFARAATEAGLPDGLLNVVTGLGSEVGSHIVRHPAVGRITFTGSVETGREVARLAAERLIPVTLELGGKSPNIIFADADLPRAAEVAARAFTSNAGQACSAGTRLLVERTVHDEVVKAVVAAVSRIEVGVGIGPIITQPQFEKVQEYFRIAASEGAELQIGGGIADDSEAVKAGQFVKPTVYTGVTNAMRIAREEVFGPVLVVIPFDTEEEALQIANDSPYGLVAGVWTQDVSRALRMSALLEAGQVFVNDWTGNVEVPFGGYKQSGYGREKGFEALLDYTRLKSVLIRL